MVCTACTSEMNEGARFCSACGRPVEYATYPFEQRQLTRSRGSRKIAGVCAGFAQYFGWDVTLVRIVLCCAVLFGAGTPVLAYLIAWIVMPESTYAVPVQSPAAGVTGS
jgi:phage shock protein C